MKHLIILSSKKSFRKGHSKCVACNSHVLEDVRLEGTQEKIGTSCCCGQHQKRNFHVCITLHQVWFLTRALKLHTCSSKLVLYLCITVHERARKIRKEAGGRSSFHFFPCKIVRGSLTREEIYWSIPVLQTKWQSTQGVSNSQNAITVVNRVLKESVQLRHQISALLYRIVIECNVKMVF